MWRVQRPELDTDNTFRICISRVRSLNLKRQLMAILPDVVAAAEDYVVKAERGCLHLIAPADTIGIVPGEEMVKTYKNRMAQKKGPGRNIYDQIKSLPANDRCPYCGHRDVSTLDHVLPESKFPIFAVTPVNLVGSCGDCNHAKLDLVPSSAHDMLLHPYFDRLPDQQWLAADVVESAPAALAFRVIDMLEWNVTLRERVAKQFHLLGLAALYSRQAACEISNIRWNLQRHFDSGGAAAVSAELRYQWESRRVNELNSWQTATYKALAESACFCNGGFASP